MSYRLSATIDQYDLGKKGRIGEGWEAGRRVGGLFKHHSESYYPEEPELCEGDVGI